MTILKAFVAVNYRATINAGFEVEVPEDVHPADRAGWAVEHYTDGDQVHSEEIHSEGLVVDSVHISELESAGSSARETFASLPGVDLVVASGGVDLIARERARQIKRWPTAHDAEHDAGELVRAAAAYASPIALYVHAVEQSPRAGSPYHGFLDIWPNDWEFKGTEKMNDHGLSPFDRPKVDRDARVAELAKAGALIAAEIDRLQCA